MAKECKVRLKSSDDKIFEVDNAVAMQSEMLKNALADTGTDSTMLQYFMKGATIFYERDYYMFPFNCFVEIRL
ncbi:hypothetical protein SUGI_0668600 [Cryptomeria japonica]|nr:hypothetical protein SUGI_0668310 [Cryptomeria japonica]GLJ33225.1 hypothetical protein SUGI_0668600 [Cryptomeria japonica]